MYSFYPMTPEQKARIEIDKKLTASGWLLQDKKESNPAAAPGVAVRELTELGKTIENAITYYNENIPGFVFDRFVIMPDHIHAIIVICHNDGDFVTGSPVS